MFFEGGLGFCVRWLYRDCLVVNDLPSIGEALPHQRKHSSGFIFLPLQVPSPKNERCVRPQEPKLQLRKIQLPHRSLVGIVLLVSRQHPIPPPRNPSPSPTTH